MNGETTNKKRMFWLIGSGLAGLALIVGFFWLLSRVEVYRYLKPRVSLARVTAEAETLKSRIPDGGKKYIRKTSADVDSSLLSYGQYIRRQTGKYPDISPCYWTIRWFSRGEHSDSVRRGNGFSARFDFNGRLLGFWDNTQRPENRRGEVSDENSALFDARYFLGEYGVKSRVLKVVSKETARHGNNFVYKFVFETQSPRLEDLVEQYTVELAGKQIVSFELKQRPDQGLLASLPPERMEDVFGVLMAVVWLSLTLVSAVGFIRKLRFDELEFSRALRIGIIGGASFLGAFIFQGYQFRSMAELLVIGVLAGGGMVLVTLVILPLAESEARVSWPRKLVYTDLIFQGRILFQETGAAIMRAFFNVGVSLMLLGGAIYVMSRFNLGYFRILPREMDAVGGVAEGVFLLVGNLLLAGLLTLTLFGFWPSFLRRRISANWLLAVVIFISIVSGHIGAATIFSHFTSLMFLTPVVIFWTFIVWRCEWVTLFFSLAGQMIFMDLIFMFLQPENVAGVIGVGTLAVTAVFFLCGAYLVFQRRSAEDFERYVPDYIGRMAEKERMVRELEIARSVQMRFLPQRVPEFPSLEIVSLCQPAMEVGGDYYDFIQMDDRHMSLLIGDVSGKGVSAAFFMTMVKGIIKTLSKKTRRPSLLLTEANEIFWENAPRNVFVTIVYGLFDLKEKTLTIARAGHNPVIWLRRCDGEISVINPRGIALGIQHGERYAQLIEDQTVTFAPGDVFVFYTDGVSESMNMDNEVFGEERLKEVIRRNVNVSPRVIQRSIVEAVASFSGKAPQHDDFTMIVVKIREE